MALLLFKRYNSLKHLTTRPPLGAEGLKRRHPCALGNCDLLSSSSHVITWLELSIMFNCPVLKPGHSLKRTKRCKRSVNSQVSKIPGDIKDINSEKLQLKLF